MCTLVYIGVHCRFCVIMNVSLVISIIMYWILSLDRKSNKHYVCVWPIGAPINALCIWSNLINDLLARSFFAFYLHSQFSFPSWSMSIFFLLRLSDICLSIMGQMIDLWLFMRLFQYSISIDVNLKLLGILNEQFGQAFVRF